MQVTLQLHKRHAKGGATFLIPGTRARVIVSRKAFGEAGVPESLTLEGEAIREPNEKELERAATIEKRVAAQDPVTLAERIAKTQKKLEKLQKMASGAEQTLPSAENQPFSEHASA